MHHCSPSRHRSNEANFSGYQAAAAAAPDGRARVAAFAAAVCRAADDPDIWSAATAEYPAMGTPSGAASTAERKRPSADGVGEARADSTARRDPFAGGVCRGALAGDVDLVPLFPARKRHQI